MGILVPMAKSKNVPIEARRIRKVRKAAGLSARQVSILSGYAPNYLARIERGATHAPAFEVMAALARVLGASLDWLAYGQGAPPSADQIRQAVEAARAASAPAQRAA